MIEKKTKIPLAVRSHQLAEVLLLKASMDNTPEGRYILGRLKTKAKHAVKRADKPAKGEWEKLRDEADRVFSIWIRKRDTKENDFGERFGKCVTCDKSHYFKSLQCGHFVRRRHFNVRWEPKNAHAQCEHCNMPHGKNGAEPQHEAFILEAYGEIELNKLLFQKRVKNPKPPIWRLKQIIERFTL